MDAGLVAEGVGRLPVHLVLAGRLVRFSALRAAARIGAAVCLAVALGDLEGPWRLAFGAALGILLLGLTIPGTTAKRLGFALLNLALLGLLLWSLDERETLFIQVSSAGISGRVADGEIQTSRTPPSGYVAIQAAEQIARRATHAPILEPLPETLRRFLLGPQTNVLTAIRLVQMDGAARPLAHATPTWQAIQEQAEHWERVATLDPGDTWLRLEIVRPSTMVRVFLGAADRSTGLVVEVRPETHHLLVADVRDGRITQQLVGGEYAYRTTPEGATRRLVRELGRSWLWALVLLATASAAGRLWSSGIRIPILPAGWLVGVLGLATLGLTLFIARTVLEGIPHVTDSVVYLFQAKMLALGRLWTPAPPLPEFFDHQHMIVAGDRWFSKYPPGPALALLPGVLAGAPWLSSPVYAALTVLLVYDLGRQAYGRWTAIAAVLLLLTSPFFLFMSGSMMGHPFALLLTMAALVGAVRAGRGQHLGAVGCGLALGLLMMTRPLTALALTVPVGAWLLVHGGRDVRQVGSTTLALIAGATLPVAGWLLYNWALTGNPFENTMQLYWPHDRPGFGPTVGNLGGHDLARGLANSWVNLLELNSQLFGWPVYLTLAPALAALLWPHRTRWDVWLSVLALAGIGCYVFWWFPGTIYGPRYAYEVVGVLALLTARGIVVFMAGAQQLSAQTRLPLASAALAAGFTVLVLGQNLVLWLPRELELHRGYNGISRGRLNAVERARLQNAVVFVSAPPTEWQAYSSVFPANSPLLDSSVLYVHDLGTARNRELLTHFPGRRGYVLSGGRLRAFD